MSEQIEVKYDKTNWKRGPWDNEPDRVDFIHEGFSCFILRNNSGNWCGYVGVPNTHRFYGKSYDDPDVSVHGGLTYAAKCAGHICHIPEPGMPDDVWWLGFDTAHAGDTTPAYDFGLHEFSTYKDMNYVIAQTKSLAEQLIERR